MESEIVDSLEKVLGHPPTKGEIAQHIADSISALERNRSIARAEGDADAIKEFSLRIRDLRMGALNLGLDPDDYKGIFRD